VAGTEAGGAGAIGAARELIDVEIKVRWVNWRARHYQGCTNSRFAIYIYIYMDVCEA